MRTFARRLAFILFILTGVYFLVTPFLVPWAAEREIRQKFADRVDGTLAFSHIAFNPFRLSFVLRDLDIRNKAGEHIVRSEKAELRLSWAKLLRGQISVRDLVVDAPDLLLEILADGGTNIGAMIRASKEKGASAPEVFVQGLRFKQAQVSIRNHDGHAVTIGPSDISLDAFALHEGHTVGLDRFVVGVGEGRITATGALDRARGDVLLDLDLEQVPVKSISGFIPMSDIYAKKGSVSGKAQLRIGDNFTVEGDLTLADLSFALEGFWVRNTDVPFAHIAGFSYDMDANALKADTLRTEGGTALLAREVERPETERPGDGPSFQIGQILMSGATVRFEDRSLPDTHKIVLDGLDAVIDGFSYDEVLSMGFRADASLGQNSPVLAAGFLEYGEALEATVSLSVDRLDHTVIKPYIFEAVGRDTRAGHAYLEFDYYISGGQIDGLNTLLFDRWEWGDKNLAFEGEEIPVTKAFNLLEDKGGRVAMEVPVEGELLDPTFRVEKLVRRATNKAVSNILTTPFRLLGKLIPGGKKSDLDLDKVPFEPMSTDLGALEKAQLHALGLALKERPRLRLRIEGSAVPGVDAVPDGDGDDSVAPDGQALLRLANQRADAVYQYLLVDGINAERLEKVVLDALEGKAPKKPMVRLEVLK